ncbi:hypothetical protein F8M41_025741 [Gigaspora margarita]|uniref:Uncharacterized protein n=1 Tax=Gigaspora margarita TaxID=4874 RepID=A0A8H3XIU3_GIGMA|nr:hypothetical protein F8M41_025741 [Gigaspora margarita]
MKRKALKYPEIPIVDGNSEKTVVNESPVVINKKCKTCKEPFWVFKKEHFKPNSSKTYENTKYKKYLNIDELQQTLKLGTSGLATYKFSQKRSHEDLSKMIILNSYSFHMVEHEGFLIFVKTRI